MDRIVIVGAGTGGTLTANLLVKDLRQMVRSGRLSIDLIEQRGEHAFQPGSLDIAFRGADPKKFLRAGTRLVDDDVQFHHTSATRIDLEARTVTLADGSILPYHHLVIATGAEARPDVLPGLSEGALSFHLGPNKSRAIWERLQAFTGGTIIVAITEVPYKCPPSPNEACFLLDEHFRKRGIRDQVQIKLLTPFPRAYPAEAVSTQVQARFDEKGILLEPFWMVAEVDAERQVIVSMEGREERYDLLIAIPPHRGAKVIQDSGIGDAEGFVAVDKETMRLPGHPEAFALGDCTSLPISKSGVVAHLQSLVVVKNILSDFGIEDGEWAYNGRINCPMEVGDHRLLWVSATYKDAPQENRPTMVKYAMKKAFNRMYWTVLSGDLEWMMRLYFGPTAQRRLPEAPGDVA